MPIDLAFATSPFIVGVSLEIATLIGLFILRTPLELAVLVLIPFNIVIVGYYIPSLIPLIGIVSGVVIGIFFLKIIRR